MRADASCSARLRCAGRGADALPVPTALLPPLTGSALFDPWRLRYRAQLGLAPGHEPARTPTRSELLLWDRLQRLPLAWVAEHPTVWGYTLDFFCPEARLAVEVDGPSHWGQRRAAADAWRDEVHERLGIRTRRFSAREVEDDVDAVVAAVGGAVASRLAEVAAGAGDPRTDDGPADLVDDERRELFPPDPPGWSQVLPAARTVLPAQAGRSWWSALRGR